MLPRTPFRSPRSIARIMLAAGLLSVCAGCATQRPAAQPAASAAPSLPALESGFLTNYSRLQPSDQSPSVLFYRDPTLKRGFRKILFRPVQVWRGADRRLDDIPESDLQYLADSFYRAMTSRLRRSFELVDKPGVNVLEIQLALTLVTKPHQKVDFFSTDVPIRNLPERTRELGDATKTFIHDCALEAEFSVSGPPPAKADGDKRRHRKRVVKAAFFDKRRGNETSKGNVQTWSDVDAVFDRWADVMDSQLVGLKDGTFKPKLTVSDTPARSK